MIHATQDPKYGIKNNQLVNMSTGEPIPKDEPVMIFRAKDRKAGGIIAEYMDRCETVSHKDIVGKRLHEFSAFAVLNPDRMKEPDTTEMPAQ